MDELEFHGRKDALRLYLQEHELANPASGDAKARSLDKIKKARALVLDFIVPERDAGDNIDITGWLAAHTAIEANWDNTESVIVDQKLPNYKSSQGTKRRRVEVHDYLLVRPIFKEYEDMIFENADHKTQQLWGICGPQGFGKSVFLHCLALKRAFTNLVVWVPGCPTTQHHFKDSLATAFYRGCQALQLTGIPYLMTSDTINHSLNVMYTFAQEKGVVLVIIVNQMHRHLEYFDDLMNALSGFAMTKRGAFVICSSSTSGTSEPIFGQSCSHLPPFDHFLLPNEIESIRNQYPQSPNLHLIADGNEWSFLNATRILSGEATNIEKLARDFAVQLLTQLNADNSADARLRKSEYMRVLYMVINGEDHQGALYFNTKWVDGDYFFVKKNGVSSKIREFMEGFAALVLDTIKNNSSYEEYLQLVIGSDSFSQITRGAQGSILEDAVSFLLRNRTDPVILKLSNLRGSVSPRAFASITLDDSRNVQRFTAVPTGGDITWTPDKEWYVGVPPEGFTGIDFILARVRMKGKTRTLEIFFLQSTVSTPQKHGIKKSTEQTKLVSSLRKKANIVKRNTDIYVVFLTPKRGTGSATGTMEYSESDVVYLHAPFQRLEGNHPLVTIIAKKCKEVWGNV